MIVLHTIIFAYSPVSVPIFSGVLLLYFLVFCSCVTIFSVFCFAISTFCLNIINMSCNVGTYLNCDFVDRLRLYVFVGIVPST